MEATDEDAVDLLHSAGGVLRVAAGGLANAHFLAPAAVVLEEALVFALADGIRVVTENEAHIRAEVALLGIESLVGIGLAGRRLIFGEVVLEVVVVIGVFASVARGVACEFALGLLEDFVGVAAGEEGLEIGELEEALEFGDFGVEEALLGENETEVFGFPALEGGEDGAVELGEFFRVFVDFLENALGLATGFFAEGLLVE
jgi:hypothetical protein